MLDYDLQKNLKVLLVANSSWYIYNFRLQLLRDLRKSNFLVEVIAPHDKFTELIIENGFKVHRWELDRKSINPLSELISFFSIFKLYKKIRPDIVHHFTIKACIYGSLSAKLNSIENVINAITGLGHLFVSKNIFKRIIRFFLRPIYTFVFTSRGSRVIFQNEDDKESLINLGITNRTVACTISGSGVDTKFFKPDINSNKIFHQPVRLLFPARLIKEKGIIELLEACDSLWRKSIFIELYIAGDLDKGNPSTLTLKQKKALQKNSKIHLLGHVSNMYELYNSIDIVILPSWREGTSKVLLEAASLEKPLITTDTSGCSNIVEHGISGLLVNLKDARSIERAILLYIHNPSFAFKLGTNARKNVVTKFNLEKINELTLKEYFSLCRDKINNFN